MLSMVIDGISSFMYSKFLVIMLIGTGVYFTIRTKQRNADITNVRNAGIVFCPCRR